jgi:ABC-type antimicrobial peptide transport system permease subunit
MGIPLREGRDIDARDRDRSTPVVLVNETLARTLWPGENAVGKFVKYVGNSDRQVVGVVGDVRQSVSTSGGGSEVYVPMRQTGDYSSVQVVIRSSVTPAAALSAVREALRPLDPSIPVNAHRILSDLVDDAIAPRRLITMLLAGFAVFSLVLAALGIFGLISYSVSQRGQEISIRMALGATAANIRGAIMKETLLLAAIGLVIGLPASLALSQTLVTLLFGVERTDPATLAAVLTLVIVVALLGGYFPARRASRVELLQAIRAK